MEKKYIELMFENKRIKVESTRFLLALNKEAKELYVLHREFPRCLIYVEQTTPLNFIVLDFFEAEEDIEEAREILTSVEFKSDIRKFVTSQAISDQDLN